jgi:hypothetical protein
MAEKSQERIEADESELKRQREIERLRRARYRSENNHIDGRPRVDKEGDGTFDPLLEQLKHHHGPKDAD